MSAQNPTIFITGIAGFIGSQFAELCVRRGFPVMGVDNLSTGYPENLPNLQQGRDWFVLDVARRANIPQITAVMLRAKARGNGKLIVVHAAAPAYDAFSNLLVALVTEGVAVGTAVTLAAAHRAGAHRFINLSSMARYEHLALDLQKLRIGYEEDDPVGGLTPYGNAKVAAEQTMRMFCDRYGISWVNIVLHNVIGVGQQYNNPLRNVAGIFLNLAIHGKPLVIHGDGSQVRSFTAWADIAAHFFELVTNERYQGLTINLGPGPEAGMSVQELAKLCTSVAANLNGVGACNAVPPLYVPQGAAVSSLLTAQCSSRRLEMLLGNLPTPDYEKVLFEMGSVIKGHSRNFDHSLTRECDLGPDALPPSLTKLSIAA